MSNGHDKNDEKIEPFRYLRNASIRLGLSKPEDEEEVSRADDPFAYLWPGTAPGGPQVPTQRSPGARFARGLGKGFLYPIRSFSETLREEQPDAGAAGGIGELVGITGAAVSFFFGGRQVITGLGLLKPVVRKGVTKLVPTATGRAVEGAIGFGAFEAFAGESPAEAPTRALLGAGAGAAFEVALMGTAAAWRGSFGAYRGVAEGASKARAIPSAAPSPQTTIHPLELRIEKWLHPEPSEGLSLFREKMDLAKTSGERLQAAIAEIAQHRMPGGQVELPFPIQSLDEVTEATNAARALGFDTGVYLSEPEGVARLFIVDNRRGFMAPKFAKEVEGLYTKPALTPEEFVELARNDIEILLAKMESVGGGAEATFSYAKPEIAIAAEGEFWMSTPEIKLALVAHEYAHYITALRGARLRVPGDNLRMISAQSGEELRKRAQFIELWPGIERSRLEPGGDIWEQFWVLSKRAERRKVTKVWLKNESKASQEAELKTMFSTKTEYFMRPTEMVSRAVEEMLVNPGKTRKDAPEVVKLMTEYLAEDGRALREIIPQEMRIVDDVLRDMWVRRQGVLSILEKGSPQVTQAQLRQFSKQGWFVGMEALVDGKSVRVMGRKIADDGEALFLVKDMSSGSTKVIPQSKMMRPVFPEILARDKEVVSAISKLLDENPKWVATWLRRWGQEVPGVTEGSEHLAKVHIDMRDVEVVRDIRKWIRENRKFLTVKEAESPLGAFRENMNMNIAKILMNKGQKSVASWDGGLNLRIHFDSEIAKAPNVALTGETRSMAWSKSQGGDIYDGAVESMRLIDVHLDDVLHSMLVQEGVPEREIPYFMKIAKEQIGQRLLDIVDPEVKTLVENARIAVELGSDDAIAAAYRGHMEIPLTNDGLTHLRDAQTGVPLGAFADRDQARAFINDAGSDPVQDLVSGPVPSDIVGGVGGGGAPPNRFQSQMPDPNFERGTRSGKLFDVGNIFGAAITAMENFASSVEARGLGPALTRVFEPGQRSMIRVLEELSEIKRAGLGDVAFADQFKKIEKLLRRMPNDRREVITDFIEYLSKEEIAEAGGLLQRAMTAREIEVANEIARAGIQHEIPHLMAIDKLTKSMLSGRSNLERTIQRMREIRLTEEGEQLLTIFENMPVFKSADEIYDVLNLSDAQRWGIKVIQDSVAAEKSKFSIMAVSRYASARPLKAGYKTGRAQFAAEQGMTKGELAAAREIEKVFEVTRDISGLDPRRYIGGYFPHLRVWTQHGFTPKNIPGAEVDIPEMLQWTAFQFRSGSLDVYNKDPLVAAYKHVRSLLMKKHFDPVLPDIKKGLEEIAKQDKRAYNIMAEYVDELLGMPHDSFKKAQAVIDGTARALGIKVPEQTVNHLVTNLAALAAGATIPFRASLIARNYFQMQQTIVPRIGMKNFWKAVKYVTAPETRKEAYEAARKGEAILPNFAPIHAATEIFGSPEVGKLSYRLQLMLEKGFTWYKNADDMGRAVAFHAQRLRIQEHLGKYVKGEIDIDEFAQLAKIDTFKEIDASRARTLFENGKYKEATDFLGMKLARETIFRYGLANHPAGWNSIYGRLFGQFGTWPVQFFDYLKQGMFHGSAKDKAEFAFYNLAINGGILAGGAGLGMNLMSWVTFPSLTYTGGPFADMAVDLVRSINGSDSERSIARMSLTQQIPVLGWALTGDPRSVFVPGSYLMGDLQSMAHEFDRGDWLAGLAEGAGFNVLRPGQDVPGIQWLLDSF